MNADRLLLHRAGDELRILTRFGGEDVSGILFETFAIEERFFASRLGQHFPEEVFGGISLADENLDTFAAPIDTEFYGCGADFAERGLEFVRHKRMMLVEVSNQSMNAVGKSYRTTDAGNSFVPCDCTLRSAGTGALSERLPFEFRGEDAEHRSCRWPGDQARGIVS